MGQSKGSKKSKRKEQERVQVLSRVRQGWSGCEIQRSSVFEASKRSLTEARCADMVNVDLNALKIGAVLLLARRHKIQVGIDSCLQ